MKDALLRKINKIAENLARGAREIGVISPWAGQIVSPESTLKKRVQVLSAIVQGNTVYALTGLTLYLRFPRRSKSRSADAFHGEVLCAVEFNQSGSLAVIRANNSSKILTLERLIEGLFPDITLGLPYVDSSVFSKRCKVILTEPDELEDDED